MNPFLLRLVALILAACCVVPATGADLFVDHVNGYTLDSAGKLQRFEAMLVEQGKVVATGSHAALAARAGAA